MKTKQYPPKLRLEYRNASELVENPSNWRRHPTHQQKALEAVISEVGWAGAALYNETTGRLIDGHLRKKIGKGKIPVLIGSWTEEQERKILATFDPIAALADADQTRLAELLQSIETQNEPIQALIKNLAQENSILLAQAGVTNGDVQTLDELTDDDNPEAEFLAPFPWFGGKSRVARFVWKVLGDVPNFIEPLFGSGACLLNRPWPHDHIETVNDFDGLVANFWRAVQVDPKAVAKWADWPVNENDANARHAWLVERKDTLQAKLEGDPDYFDVKIAGWWVWGMACWIGSGFCSGEGPWRVQDVDGVRQLVHLSGTGQGVNRQLVHLSGTGQGVNRKRVSESTEGKPGRGEQGLYAWMQALSERFRRVRVCCGDWTRVCGGQTGDALQHFFAHGQLCGVFLDPPYADTAGRTESIYRQEDLQVAHAVREWCIKHGDDPRLRIVLCGYDGEHEMPKSWRVVAWKALGGMAGLAKGKELGTGQENRFRERLWLSPHCLKP